MSTTTTTAPTAARAAAASSSSAPTASAISKDVNIFESGEQLDGRVFVGGEFVGGCHDGGGMSETRLDFTVTTNASTLVYASASVADSLAPGDRVRIEGSLSADGSAEPYAVYTVAATESKLGRRRCLVEATPTSEVSNGGASA